MQIYREALHPNGKVIYISKHSKHGAPGPLHGKPISAPCGPLEGMQQKRLAARRHKTTYAYDFPTVFGNALREIWTTRAISGEPGSVPKGMHSCVPCALPWQACLGGTPQKLNSSGGLQSHLRCGSHGTAAAELRVLCDQTTASAMADFLEPSFYYYCSRRPVTS